MTGLFKRLLWIVGTFGYIIVFSEVFVRIFAPQSFMPRNIEAADIGIRANIPNITYHHSTPETEVAFKINALGMRDAREFSEKKPENLCRIEMFGDSFFMGYELNDKDTIAARLETDLRQAGYEVEVLNFAVSGYGTAESLRMFERRGVKFAPDIVLYEWHSSDFADNVRSALFKVTDEGLEKYNETYLPLADAESRLMNVALFKFLSNHSHFFVLLRNSATRYATQSMAKDDSEKKASSKEEQGRFSWIASKYSIQLSRALIIQAQREASDAGADFAVVDIPYRYSGGAFDTVSLLELPKEEPVVNSLATLLQQDRSLKTIYYQRGQGHFSPLGAQLVAENAEKWVLGSKKLERCKHSLSAVERSNSRSVNPAARPGQGTASIMAPVPDKSGRN